MGVAAKAASASLILLVALGCSDKPAHPRGDFEFRNASDSMIWVDHVPWHSENIRCGVLIPGANKGHNLILRDASVPEKTTIKWWKGDREDRKSEIYSFELELGSLTRNWPADLLVFELQPDETWTARFVRNPYR
jgi:hypothetical protein